MLAELTEAFLKYKRIKMNSIIKEMMRPWSLIASFHGTVLRKK
jgi:hypothetical protein